MEGRFPHRSELPESRCCTPGKTPQLLLSDCEVPHRNAGLVVGISVQGEILIHIPIKRGASLELSPGHSLTKEPGRCNQK